MTHKAKVLALLSDGQPHTHHELYQLGCVAHSRVSDLRRDGHTINCWRDGDLSYYQLAALAQPDSLSTLPGAGGRESGHASAGERPTGLASPAALPEEPSTGEAELSLFTMPADRERWAA